MLDEDLDSELDDDVCISPQVESKRLAPESFVELREEECREAREEGPKRLAPESFVELHEEECREAREEGEAAAPPYRPKPDRPGGGEGEEDNLGGAGAEDWSRSKRETFARRSSSSEARASFVLVEGDVASAINLLEVL